MAARSEWQHAASGALPSHSAAPPSPFIDHCPGNLETVECDNRRANRQAAALNNLLEANGTPAKRFQKSVFQRPGYDGGGRGCGA